MSGMKSAIRSIVEKFVGSKKSAKKKTSAKPSEESEEKVAKTKKPSSKKVSSSEKTPSPSKKPKTEKVPSAKKAASKKTPKKAATLKPFESPPKSKTSSKSAEPSPKPKKASKKAPKKKDEDGPDLVVEENEKKGAEPKKPKGPTVYRCTKCEDMTKVCSPTCRCCGASNGYQPMPPGTRLPKKRHGYVKQAGGFGKSFGGDDLGFGGGAGGKMKSDDDEDDFDPDDVPDVTAIGDVEVEERVRISTGIPALNRVLGGNDEEGYGIVAGSSVMIDGPPGIGKSTLLIQALARLSEQGTVLYITGEESAGDIRARANRLKILTKKALKNILVIETTDTDFVIDTIEEEEPVAVILDSVQMFYSENASGQAGSEPQCKYILEEMIRGVTKPLGIALFLVSQVTKDGDARGPQTIAHMVDGHFKFESKDPKNRGEIMRVLYQKKNRNGDISIISYFKMTGEGLKGLKEKPGQSIADVEEGESPRMPSFGL
jgi:KaiC/GvpD/RAD55 family RecA-like ATPase